jgi:hypothetical protein
MNPVMPTPVESVRYCPPSAGVGKSLRELRRLGIEQDARRLAGAGGEHDDARLDVVLLAGDAIDVRDPFARPLASTVTSRAMALVRSVSRPVFMAGGSSTDGEEKFECNAQPRAHFTAVVTRRTVAQRLRDDRHARGHAGMSSLFAAFLISSS